MGLFDDLIPSGGGDAPAGVPRITVRPKIDIPASGRALLDTIAGSESPGYDTMYGGGKFQDFTDHPRQAVPIPSGTNAGRTSSAAGRYQFLGPTWDQVKQETGLPDFSPDSQDQGAWYLAQKTYQQKTGRELARDLESAKGNPNAVAGIGKMLSGVWTSLPGGIEPNKATASFANRYNGAQAPTDMSSQARRPAGGLFDDLIPQAAQSQQAAPEPMADNGGQFASPLPSGENIRTAREGVSPPVPTAGEAAQGGFFRGATFNFIDELNGLAAAGGLDPNNPKHDEMTAALAILKGAYRKTMGDKEADAAYRVKVSEMRAQAADERQFQSGAELLGNLGGAVATAPFTGGAGGGAGLGARAVQGARIGAVQGGLGGIGEGTDLQSRATGGVIGAGTGAAFGAALPVGVEGAVQAGRFAAKPLQGAVQAVRGIRDPEAEAARRITGALQRDTKTAGGPAGLTAPEYAGSVNAGGPAAVMDLGGETTRALARSAANTSPEARAALGGTVNDRFESQSDRVTGWLNKTFGPSDTGATREALQEAAQKANRPAYRKAYSEGDRPLWSPQLELLVSSPDVAAAMKEAAVKGKSRAVLDGFGGFNAGANVSDSGVVSFPKKNGVTAYPNLQFWDYTKRALDDAGKKAARSGATDEASVIGQLATSLRNELDSMVPSYGAARAGAARFFGAQDASEAGQKFLTSNIPIADARRSFAQMSPPERQLFRESFIQSLTQKIEATGDRRNVLNSIAQSPRARQQMEIAMGPQGAREFEAMMRVEGVMDLARGAVQGNSTTARQLAELGLAGGAYGLGSGGDIMNPNPSALATAALVYGAAKGKGVIDQRVARHIGEMLASNDTTVLRKGINIVARNQNLLNALRSFDRGVVSAGSQQGRGLVPVQAGAIGRADDNQNDVPRPPGQ